MENGIGTTVKSESKLNELTSRVDRVCGNLNRNIDKLNTINDTLMGSCSENDEVQTPQPSRVGDIGRLEDMIALIEERAGCMNRSVDRLVESNIII